VGLGARGRRGGRRDERGEERREAEAAGEGGGVAHAAVIGSGRGALIGHPSVPRTVELRTGPG
jgi:hypothetical protein